MAPRIIVVGGGLAGLSAAHSAIEHGASVVLLDKNAYCGGNSTKATSGINGAGTRFQRALGIQDSAEAFLEDTRKGGARNLEIATAMTRLSAPGVEWLHNAFGLDLDLVSRLGGHSNQRTHRTKERFPGMTITYRLLERFEELAGKAPHIAKLVNKAKVIRLLRGPEGQVQGCVYTLDGHEHTLEGLVILATGGYGADFGKAGLLANHRSDLLNLPTTCGDHCTGDGVSLGVEVGASTIDLDQVQVHPTGLVNPKDPNAKTKFLAAEALRGVGGFLLNNKGQRFYNELGRRDDVTKAMWKDGQSPFFLCLNSKASKELEWHCKHYVGRGLMERFSSLAQFAQKYKIDPAVLKETLRAWNEVGAKQIETRGEGGPYKAYPDGTTHDPLGKKFFTNLPCEFEDGYHVCIVTPVVHYTMGGLKVNAQAQVMQDSQVVPGMYAAGEVAGGVHGENRLGGSSLLDCVVFGKEAGRQAAGALLTQLSAVSKL